MKDPVCGACQFQAQCIPYMGQRELRTELRHATFKLSQLSVEEPNLKERIVSGDGSVFEIYRACYAEVFKKTPDDLSKHDPDGTRLRDLAHEHDLSIRMFILTAMTGHSRASPGRPYYAPMLLGEYASRTVARYRAASIAEYGGFDAHSLHRLTGDNPHDLELKKNMHDSEHLAASWIVGWKIKRGGDPVKLLYAQRELALDPVWLSIEPSYRDKIFTPYVRDQDRATTAQAKHRLSVSRSIKELRKGGYANAVRLREEIMHDVAKEVLYHYGLGLDDLMVESPVIDAVKFWSSIGLAIQHLYCLDFISGNDEAGKMLQVAGSDAVRYHDV